MEQNSLTKMCTFIWETKRKIKFVKGYKYHKLLSYFSSIFQADDIRRILSANFCGRGLIT